MPVDMGGKADLTFLYKEMKLFINITIQALICRV